MSEEDLLEQAAATGNNVFPEEELLEKVLQSKDLIFSVRQRIKSTNWYCKETVSKIRQCFWVL